MSQYEADIGIAGIHPNRPDLDCAPLLDNLRNGVAGISEFVWPSGVYYFYSQPKPINARGLTHRSAGRMGAALIKAFESTNDYGGIFNLDWGASGFGIKNFGMASDGRSKGTGSLISLVPTHPAGQALSEVMIENCYLTSEVRPDGAHKYGIYADGYLGGEAKTPMVRGLDIIRTRVFGTVKGGYSMLFYCCGGVGIDAGGWTPGSTGPDAIVRFDGPNGPDTSLNTQNSTVRPGAAYDIQFGNANNILVDTTWIYRISRTPRTSFVRVTGPIYLGNAGAIGDWSGKDGCKWNP